MIIEVDGEKTEFFFLVDPDDRRDQNRPLPREVSEALEGLARLNESVAGGSPNQ